MLNILPHKWGKKGKKQKHTENKAIFQTLKWNKNDTLLQLPVKRAAIDFDCKGPWECVYSWWRSLKKGTIQRIQTNLYTNVHTGIMDYSRIRINTAGTGCHKSISYFHSLTNWPLHPPSRFKLGNGKTKEGVKPKKTHTQERQCDIDFFF